jgi:hypothetical protein
LAKITEKSLALSSIINSIFSNKHLYVNNSLTSGMTNRDLFLASFIAFLILAVAATIIVTQEAYAKEHTHPKILNMKNQLKYSSA